MLTPWLLLFSHAILVLWLDPNVGLWFPPFPVSYLSLHWGCPFCSVLVCQHNQCNVRSLASLLILDFWTSFQSTSHVHDQTSVLKVRILQLLFCVCNSYVVSSNVPTVNTFTATIMETFVRIAHNFQHFTVCQRFFSHCCAPVSFLSQALNEVKQRHVGRIPAITEYMLIATLNERLNYSLPFYRRKWHMISVLTSSQQQKWSPCSARVGDEENISNYLTQYNIYESFSNSRRNLKS